MSEDKKEETAPEKATKEIEKVLNEHDCVLVPVATMIGNGIQQSVKVVDKKEIEESGKDKE